MSRPSSENGETGWGTAADYGLSGHLDVEASRLGQRFGPRVREHPPRLSLENLARDPLLDQMAGAALTDHCQYPPSLRTGASLM